LLSVETSDPGPLARALRHKARTSASGAAEATAVAAGDGWNVVDIVCTSGPCDRPFEERHSSASISLVLSGAFVYRGTKGSSLLSAGSVVLGNAGKTYECSHQHGEGDRCLSFSFEPELFERLAHDAGAVRAAFEHDRLPPLRALAPLAARARRAMDDTEGLEEIALELAGGVVEVAVSARHGGSSGAAPDPARIAPLLRDLEAHSAEPHALPELARRAGLSRYHFLRTFKEVTGVTPHQWLLRARLRDAAHRLASTRAPVTQIALDVGFEDLSNFIRSFRAEFGVSPRRYRAGA
jgi:AraC-like DNA-binding protein